MANGSAAPNPREVTQEARAKVPQALTALHDLLDSKNAAHRLRATDLILDRANSPLPQDSEPQASTMDYMRLNREEQILLVRLMKKAAGRPDENEDEEDNRIEE